MLTLGVNLYRVLNVMLQHHDTFHDNGCLIFNLRCIFSVLLYVLVLEIKGKREGVVAALEGAF